MTQRTDYLDNVAKLKTLAEKYYHSQDTENLPPDESYDLFLEEVSLVGEGNGWTEHLDLIKKVAGGTNSDKATITYKKRMLSLNKVKEPEELEKFIKRANPQNESDFFVLEPKLDGLALTATYENGQRKIVSSRGDSYTGEDYTERANELTIKGLPKTISNLSNIEVRGELFITNEDFNTIQKKRIEAVEAYDRQKEAEEAEKAQAKLENRKPRKIEGRKTVPPKPFTINRSAVSGLINAKPGTDSEGVVLTFAAYDFLFEDESLQPDTYTEALEIAVANNINTASGILPTLEGDTVQDMVKAFGEAREELNYPTDGSVIKVNSKAARNALGEGEKHPYWAVAYKYKEPIKKAVLSHIVRAVGKSGAISYVGIFEKPIDLGTQVGRVTLNNAEIIKTLDVREGDTVFVRKAHGIIPELVAVSLTDRSPTNPPKPYYAPRTCPSCGGDLDTESSVVWRCHNPECSKTEAIIYAASKKNFDITGLGSSTIETLVLNGVISDAADLFTLSLDQWVNLPIGFTSTGEEILYGAKKAAIVMKSLEKAKTVPLNKIISSLNIRFVGNTLGRRIADHFQSFDKFTQAGVNELTEVEGIKGKAETIVEGIQARQDLIYKYKKIGFDNLEPASDVVSNSNNVPTPLTGHKIVITGAVPGFSRDEMKDIITNAGGQASSSVSNRTTLLVAPIDQRNTTKADKAERLGVLMITPEEFLDMLEPFFKAQS